MFSPLIPTSKEELWADIEGLIQTKAFEFGLDPKIVGAIVYQESVRGSDSLFDAVFAVRREPGFLRRYILGKSLTGYVPPNGLPTKNTERFGRGWSYGLMQIMGSTARENGLESQYITALFNPETNITVGCRYLKSLLRKEGTYSRALVRWNGTGRRAELYSKKVMGFADENAFSSVIA